MVVSAEVSVMEVGGAEVGRAEVGGAEVSRVEVTHQLRKPCANCVIASECICISKNLILEIDKILTRRAFFTVI